MKKNLSLLILLLIIMTGSYAQNNPEIHKKLMQQADDMGKKFIAKDYAGFLKYTHPATVKAMGGQQRMLQETVKSFQELEKDGIVFLDVKFGETSKILTVGNELQCTMPEIIEMHITGGKYTTISTLIAISEDKGNKWYFLDTGGNDLSLMQMLHANLSNELVIPAPSDPIFEEDKKKE